MENIIKLANKMAFCETDVFSARYDSYGIQYPINHCLRQFNSISCVIQIRCNINDLANFLDDCERYFNE